LAFPPWHELKQAEMQLLAQRRAGSHAPDALDELRRLLVLAAEDPEADGAICYHGAKALVFECDGDVEKAIRHREVEIHRIECLHDLARQNPGDAAALENYELSDLQVRRDILDGLRGHAI
jgi:hypothetical protein